MTTIPDVAWSRVAGFVRQHTHDLRNELNGLDLEAALLADIVNDAEARESVSRIRAEIRKMAANLRSLSAKFAESRPSRLRIAASELFLIWQDQATDLPGLEIDWQSEVGNEAINIDPGSISQALRELLANAQSFGAGERLKARAYAEEEVIFELREPKKDTIDPARWGRSPFVSTRRGGYGLGLCALLQIVEANGGNVAWEFDSHAHELVTRLSFPVAPEE